MAIFSLNEVRTEQIKNIANDNFESWPESATYGYFGGGAAPGSPGNRSTIDRIDFFNETLSLPGNNLPQARRQLAATSSSSYGYFGGGQGIPEFPGRVCTIERLDFSNETTSVPGNNLPQARRDLAAVSSNLYGYFGGGFASGPGRVSTLYRVYFSYETLSLLANTFPPARRHLAAVQT